MLVTKVYISNLIVILNTLIRFKSNSLVLYKMGKNRVQRKEKEKNKPKKDNIYSKKHVRISLMKQEKHFEKLKGNKKL